MLTAAFCFVFQLIQSHTNDANPGASEYGTAMWLTLAAFVVLFLAMIATCFACITDRRKRRF